MTQRFRGTAGEEIAHQGKTGEIQRKKITPEQENAALGTQLFI